MMDLLLAPWKSIFRATNTNGKDNITIEHMLTMTSGLEWQEWSAPYSSMDNPSAGIWFSDKDPITFILEMPLIDEPGTNFNYSSGNMIVLGELIRNATNMSINDFSQKYLFEPLAIDSSDWAVQFGNGVDNGPVYTTLIGASFAFLQKK